MIYRLSAPLQKFLAEEKALEAMGIPRFDAALSLKPPPHSLLSAALRSKSTPRLIAGLQAVLIATNSFDHTAELVATGGIHATVSSLEHPSRNAQSRKLSVKVLYTLSDEYSAALRAASATRVLSRVICDYVRESREILGMACVTLLELVRESPGAALEALSFGIVPPLCRILEGGDAKLASAALMILDALARLGGTLRTAIAQADGIRSIANIGCPASGICPNVTVNALSTLSVLAGHSDTRGYVVKAGGLGIAVHTLVREKSVPAATYAARLIAGICTVAHGRQAAITEGAVLAAVSRLRTSEKSHELTFALCVCLVRMFQEPGAADEAIAAGRTVETMLLVYLCSTLPHLMLFARRAVVLLALGSPARRAKVLFALKYLLRVVDGEQASRLEALHHAIAGEDSDGENESFAVCSVRLALLQTVST